MATPPWQQATETADAAAEPTSDELAKQLALVGKRGPGAALSDSEDDSSDSEEDERLRPPGPLDPDKCLVFGPGVSGGSAGAAVSFFVTCKDSSGKRIPEGGAHVEALVIPKSLAPANEEVAVLIRDNCDGSYTGVYTVSARGNYELTVEINGTPTGGSPFPVFFSPPEPKPDAEAGSDGAAALAAAPANSLAATAQEIARTLQPDLAKLSAASEAAAAAMLAQQKSMGGAAHTAGVVFPTDEDLLKRTLLVANMPKSIKPDQLKQLFGFCGAVVDSSLQGTAQDYAFVEYSNEEGARAALAMNNMSVMGAIIKVELAASAHRASPQGAPNPFAAMQAHQLAQLQLAQMQQESLAAQVAQMRAAAKSLPGLPTAPVVANNSQSQRAAALAAAAALSKRLQGLGGASTSYIPPSPPRKRAYSPPRRRPSPSPPRRRRRTPSPPRRRPKSHDRSSRRSRSPRGRGRSSDRRRGSREPKAQRDGSRERRHRRRVSKSPSRGSRGKDEPRGSRAERSARDGSGRSRERSSRRSPVADGKGEKEKDPSRRRRPEADVGDAKPRRREEAEHSRSRRSPADEKEGRNRSRRGDRSDRDARRGDGSSRRHASADGTAEDRPRRGEDAERSRRRDNAERSSRKRGARDDEAAEPADLPAPAAGGSPADAGGSPTAAVAADSGPAADVSDAGAAAGLVGTDCANGHAEAAADDVAGQPLESGGREGRRYRKSGDADAELQENGGGGSAPNSAHKRGRSASPDGEDRGGGKKSRRDKKDKHKRHKHKRHRREADAAGSDGEGAAAKEEDNQTKDAVGAPETGTEQSEEQEQLRKLALEKFEATKQAA